MDECPNLSECNFFKMYESDESKHLALKGFISMFCKGAKQDQCIRKDISTALGGPQNVPPNMLPNGLPMAGTKKSNWSENVTQLLKF